MKIENQNELTKAELTLAIPEELLEKAKDAAKSTRENDAFRFTICYDASHAENLKVLLQTAGVYPEKETENTFTAYMTMEQLKLVKSLEFVEQAIEADAMPQEVRKALVSQKPKKEDEPQEPAAPATHSAEANAVELSEGNPAEIAVQCTGSGCASNKDMESAKEISVGSYVRGCICCPRTEHWFKFTVPQSKTYTIYTSGSLDTQGTLFDCYGDAIATNDDYAGKLNFRIVQSLTAGTTYYVKVRAFGSNIGSYTICVTDRIFASHVTISQKSFTLVKGELYELPVTPNYTYKEYLGAKRIPGLSVSVFPTNANEQGVWWWDQFNGVLDCSYGWDKDGDRYIHVTAKKVGTSKLYAQDRNENGKVDECTVTVISPYQNQLITSCGFSLEEANLILKCYNRIEAVFNSESTLQKAWKCARLLSEFCYDDPTLGVINAWDKAAGSVTTQENRENYFLDVLGYSKSEYDKLNHALNRNHSDADAKHLLIDFTHMQFALAARLAYTLDKDKILSNLLAWVKTGNLKIYSDEDIGHMGGWLGDAVIAGYYGSGDVSFGNDDYMADLDAENIYQLLMQGYSSLDAINHYYGDMLLSETRADIFLQNIPYDTVKSKIFYEMIDWDLYRLMSDAADQGNILLVKYYTDLINNEQYHFDEIKSRHPETYDFLMSVNDRLSTMKHYQ